MKTLTAFASMIRNHLPVLGVEAHQVSVFMENGTAKTGSGKRTEAGRHLSDFEYRIALSIENMPVASGGYLLAAMQAFAMPLDRDQLSDLQFEVTAVTDRLIDIDASLEVRDPVFIQKAQQGPIKTSEGEFDFSENPFAVAETLDRILVDVKD